MKALIFALSLLVSNFAYAAGAEQYKTLKEVKNADLYRLTCSDTKGTPQIHVFAEVAKSKVTALKIFTIVPAVSANVIDYTENAQSIDVNLETSTLSLKGDFPGVYWNVELELNVKDTAKGLAGTFNYDDGDGSWASRKVTCGAVNYLLSPSN